jgi:hypothetical protein
MNIEPGRWSPRSYSNRSKQNADGRIDSALLAEELRSGPELVLLAIILRRQSLDRVPRF